MAKLELTIELGPAMRKAMISAGADLVDAMPQYRYAIILELLRRDNMSRVSIAEEMGEAAMRERKNDVNQQALLDMTDQIVGHVEDKSWDQIMLECLDRMQDTPGGRGEVE